MASCDAYLLALLFTSRHQGCGQLRSIFVRVSDISQLVAARFALKYNIFVETGQDLPCFPESFDRTGMLRVPSTFVRASSRMMTLVQSWMLCEKVPVDRTFCSSSAWQKRILRGETYKCCRLFNRFVYINVSGRNDAASLNRYHTSHESRPRSLWFRVIDYALFPT